jgi:hypothetical protein
MAKVLRLFALPLLIAAAMPAQTESSREVLTLGTLVDGVYHHNRTGIQFAVPSGWVIVTEGTSSSGGQAVTLRDAETNFTATVWMKARKVDPADIPALMDRRLDDKAAQRNNFQGYTYRADSVQHTTIGGQPALSAVADYQRTGQHMVESLTWVEGEKSRVVFVGRVPASDLTDFQGRFDEVIRSVVVP